MPILATRGWPYKCSFCSSPNMWTTRYVVREPTDVADEIESYIERFGINNVDFVDLTPMTKRSWILRLCDELDQRGLALENMGDIAYQSIAGATATATHGTGWHFGNISSRIVGMRLIAGDGSIVDCSAEQNPEVLACGISIDSFATASRRPPPLGRRRSSF